MGRMIQNNFSGGEISPTLFGRSDLQAYYKGCANAENFVVSKEGTLRKRHGIVSARDLSGYSHDDGFRIFPYKYDRTDGGVLALANLPNDATPQIGYILYSKNLATVKASGTFVSGTYARSDLDAIQCKQIGDQLWITNGSFFKVATITNNATVTVSGWSQSSKPSAVTSISASGYKADGTSYAPSSGRQISYAAYVVKDGVMSSRMTANITWSKDWASGYYIEVTVTVGSRTGIDYILLTKRIGGSYGEVARWYPEDLSSNTATFRDENISAGDAVYAQTNVLGSGFTNPLCVDCFQQRKVFANATTDGASYPMTMWFSEVGNLGNFYADRPTVDSDAFSPTISSTGPAFIRWVVCYQEVMVLFTDCGLFSVGFSQTQGFSASTCRISRFSQISASRAIQPVVTDAGVVFVGSDNKTLYTASYDVQENMLKPVNRSVLVEHLTRTSGIRAIALQEYPNTVIWCATEDGRLLSFTYERNEDVYCWSHSVVEGATVVDVISLGTVTDSSTDRTTSDLVFVVSKDGVYYLCTFGGGYADNIGGSTTNVTATLTTLRPESQDKTLVGYRKNVKDIILRLYNTGGLSVKPADGGSAMPLVAARTGTSGLFTGEVKVMPRGFVNDDGQLTFVSDDARQCEILQVVTLMEVC